MAKKKPLAIKVQPLNAKPANENRVTFSTGAVRSSDAEAYRYDLVSPIGFRRFLCYLQEQYVPSDDGTVLSLDECLTHIYAYLGGDRCDTLECATCCLFSAIEAKHGRKWDYNGIPPGGLQGVAEACHEGAAKYGDWNWEAGMPVSDILNHAIRHIVLFKSGDTAENHLGHCAWNLFAAMHSDELWQELNAGKLRGPGCKPPVEEAAA